MTIKELIPKLIEHYEKCINEMPEEGWVIYLCEKEVYSGICHCSYEIFNEHIYNSDFSKVFTYGNDFLCLIPHRANSYSEAKELLQIRLNRLKEFL